MGAHRDPITSEKSWLDCAVRELSRVAAGKARGQEAVWRSQCKPSWWDSVCPHPWKNPTANPKDCKDTLKAKFECLVQHLRKEGQLPCEMEEEIALWEAGKVSEVFLMTAFSSLLGQASNLHSVLGNTCRKMEDTGISIAPSILTDLQRCLSACVDKIDTIKSLATQSNKNSTDSGVAQAPRCSGLKHQRDESDSDDLSQTPKKRPKRSSSDSSHLSSAASPSASSRQSPVSVQPVSKSNTPLSPEQQKLVLALLLQKRLLQKQMAETTAATLPAPHKTNVLKPRRVPSTGRSRPSAQKKVNQGSVAAVVAVNARPAVTLPATVSTHSVPENMPETSEFGDLLSSDLVENEDNINLNFWDEIMEETSPNVSVSPNSTAVVAEVLGLGSLCDSVQPTSEMMTFDRSPVQNETPSPNPLLCPTMVAMEVSPTNPLQFEIPVEAVAGRSLGGEAAAISDDFGTTLCADAGDFSTVLNETEVVSDLGYSSEGSTSSPTSHRSSLDSDAYSHTDISSPDLEAFLDLCNYC